MEKVEQHTTSAPQRTTDKSKPKGSTTNTKVVKTSVDGQNVQTPEQRKVTGRILKTKRVTESPDDKQKTTGQRKSHSGNRSRPASTVLTESIAEHDDKQTPSNQIKSNRCKLKSTVLTEYNGARPKTTKPIADEQTVLGDTQSIEASLHTTMEEVKQHTKSAKQTTTDKIKQRGSTPNTKVVKTSIDGQNVQTPEQRKVTGRILKTKRVTESPDEKQKKTTGQRKSHSGNRGRPASTVLTESITEHDDKQTPSNQMKSNRCKLNSTVLTEYNGARPKTTKTIEDKQTVLGDTQSIEASIQTTMEEVKQHTKSAKQTTTDTIKQRGSTPNTKVVKTSIDGQNIQTPEQRKVNGRILKTKIVTEAPDDKQTKTGQRKSHSGNRGRPASTVLTESIAEHDEKQTPSNQIKSNRCKLKSTVLTEYNGARPKTTQPIEDKRTVKCEPTDVRKKTKQMKCKDQKQPKTQYTSLEPPVASVGITIIAMNVDGKQAGPGTAERRKQAIQSIIENGRPDVVLFQEYKLEEINKWKNYQLPEHYVYTGNKDASFLFDIRNIIPEVIRDREIRKIVEKLQRTPNNRLRVAFPGDFNPIPRMCMTIVETKGATLLKFICVSWHGRWNNGYSKEEVRKSEFIYFMEFLWVVHKQYELALLVGGDFNIDLPVIETEIKPPFVLYTYTASPRRLLNGIKDYFIGTDDLLLTNIKYIPLQNDTKASNPEDVLDHDPLIAQLSKKRQ